MRRILVPILGLVSLVLLGIAFGLASLSIATRVASDTVVGVSYYQAVWQGDNLNALNIVGFFLLCFAPLFVLCGLLPLKVRKFILIGAALVSIAAGVFILILPNFYFGSEVSKYSVNGGLIATGVLAIVAGALECLGALLDFKKE